MQFFISEPLLNKQLKFYEEYFRLQNLKGFKKWRKKSAKTINSLGIKLENVEGRVQRHSDFLIHKSTDRKQFGGRVSFCCLVN
jgi:hypothetical protein